MVRTLNSELHSIHNYMNASIVVIKTIYGMKSILSPFQFTIKIQNYCLNFLHYIMYIRTPTIYIINIQIKLILKFKFK